jgi:Fe-S cluster assembly iron-binding protein IscA
MVNVTDLNRDGAAKMVGDIATLYQNLHADLQAAQGGGGGGKSTFGYRHEVTPFDAAAATAKDKATVMANLGSMPKITSAELDSFRELLDSA